MQSTRTGVVNVTELTNRGVGASTKMKKKSLRLEGSEGALNDIVVEGAHASRRRVFVRLRTMECDGAVRAGRVCAKKIM